ncbi:MAG: hypothetical protein FWD43_06110 [Coriobacteriia bacterium]|nr:hypothetical protein [Coriobacteriia bacterium]
MLKKLIKIIKYVLFLLLSTTLYGLAMYFVYTWLVGYSLLLAYLGNLILIIIALVWDESNFKLYDSLVKSKDALKELKNSRYFRWILDSFISFKAALYLFYVLIMVFSQIINAYPTLAYESLASFIAANEYSILLLIAVDLFSGQFVKDRKRMSSVLERFEKAWKEEEGS